MARRRKTRKSPKARKSTSTGCRCKIGSDGRKHCWKPTRGGGIKACKVR